MKPTTAATSAKAMRSHGRTVRSGFIARSLIPTRNVFYAASGTARALASARLRRASKVRSAWSATGSSPRTRRGASPYSCFKRPNSLSTADRPR